MIAAIQAKRATKKEKDDRRPNFLAAHASRAVEAIDFFLRKEPEVKDDELEPANQNYLDKIAGASSTDQIDAITSRVLKNIEQIRKAKTKDQDPAILLEVLKNETIDLIHQELKHKPELSESDISYPN